MTKDQIIDNIKSELNTRLSDYENKVEEFSTLADEYPDYPKYAKAVDYYEIKLQEVQDILNQLNKYGWQ